MRVGASGLRLRANVTVVLDATVNARDDGGAIDVVDARPATGETAAFATWIAATNIDRLEHTIVV